MKIPLGIAKKMALMFTGDTVPGSQLKHAVVEAMRSDEVIHAKNLGKSRKLFFIPDKEKFSFYLKNQFGIEDLSAYIEMLETGASRADAVRVSARSKTKTIRTFKGFPVHSYMSIGVEINNQKFAIQQAEGCFTFISDFETFRIPEKVTVVGVENAENFRYVEEQAYLFSSITPLFVSRYPQTNDLLRWLKQIRNPYLHFGDFDFAGIQIFENEFLKHLSQRASFFIPENIEEMIAEFGNRELYNNQLYMQKNTYTDSSLEKLIALFHKHKKCLEQEVLIIKNR